MDATTHVEFESEMELERARLISRRFVWMVGVTLLLSVPGLLITWLAASEPDFRQEANRIRFGWALITTMLYVAAAVVVIVKRRQARFTSLLALALISFMAALHTPIERMAASLEGSYSLAQLAERQAATSRPRGGNAGGPATTAPATQPRDGVPPSRTVELRPGLSIEFEGRTGPAPAGDPGQPQPDGRSIRVIRSTATADPTTTDPTTTDPTTTDPTTTGSSTTGSTTLPANGPATRVIVTRGTSNADRIVRHTFNAVSTPGFRTAFSGMLTLLMLHAVACIFMPWTFRESLVPGVAGVVGYGSVLAADAMLGHVSWVVLAAGLIGVFLAIVPGSTLCWWRHSRYRADFRLRFESGRYRQLRGELANARRIHESCLPPPLLTGPARLAYLYRPMRDIGGDLLMCRRMGTAENAPILVAIIDVTGHGIAAALTVNRLLGELDRIVGERPDIRPAAALAALNRYVTLMLGAQGLYLSAAIFLLDPVARSLTYANGGHPTAYLLRQGRCAELLDSTSTLLGVLPPDEYDAEERTLPLEPNDVIIACTDGAIETQLADGTLLLTSGLGAMAEEVASVGTIGPEGMPEALHRRLDGLRDGDLADDTLIVAMWLAAGPVQGEAASRI